MPTNLSREDLCNVALNKIGMRGITSIQDQASSSALACNVNFNLVIGEVSRAHNWNCLTRVLTLVPVTQTAVVNNATPTPVTAWLPNTNYVQNQYVSYGLYIYQAFFAHTSSANFTNDLTAGEWFQTDFVATNGFLASPPSGAYPSGWNFQYPLPPDYILMVSLNDIPCDPSSRLWEVIGSSLYTNDSQAIIKYVGFVTDTTQYDPLFTAAFTTLLAAKISVILRQEDGNLQARLMQEYRKSLSEARVKDGNEKRARRFNPVRDSNFVKSRWNSTNN
jgi:hypothetical protein